MNIEKFLARPYGDRQLIEFVDDLKVTARPFATSAKVVAAGVSLFVPMIAGIPVLGYLGISEMRRKRRRKGLVITLIKKSDLVSFQLPPAHPSDRVIYVAHPVIPKQYIPFADFHRFVFEHKFSELVKLLSHLGAKTIEVHHVRGWGKESIGNLSLKLDKIAQGKKSDIKATQTECTEQTILYKAEFEGHGPSIPANLLWLREEQGWQQIAEQRLNHGLQNFELYYKYTSDFSINATTAATLKKIGFELGGEFEGFTLTEWRIKGTF